MKYSNIKLKHIIKVAGGKRLPFQHEFTLEKTLHPYIRARDIRDGKITFDDPVYIEDKTFLHIKNYIVNTRDVCITIVGANVGDVGDVPEFLNGANLTENAVKLTPKNSNFDCIFLKYCLLTTELRDKMKQLGAGAAAQQKLGLYKINELELPYPSIGIQKRIASILLTFDKFIEINNKKIKILEQMARLLYQEWFVEFRFPGHEKVKFVDSELGKIPEGWKVTKVKSLVTRLSPGGLYDSNTVCERGKVPVLDQGQSGVIGYHNNAPGFEATLENPVIIFANHTCYQRIINFAFSTIQNVLPFKPSEENFRNIYWLHYSTDNLIEFNDYKGHWPEFMTKKLVLPPAQICDQFGSIAKYITDCIFYHQNQNKTLVSMRDLLLPKLMSGEIDVSKLDIKIDN